MDMEIISSSYSRWIIATVFLVSCAASNSVSQPDRKSTQEKTLYDQLQIFGDVLSAVKIDYVEEPDMEKFMEGAIKGGLQTLDPYSSYMPPEELKMMETKTKGMLGGTGIEIGIKGGVLTVIAPIEDMPAFRAGLQAGDKIVKIENESTKGMKLMDAVERLEGEPGTQVSVTVMRDSLHDPKIYTLTREIIPNVTFRAMEKGIVYVKILKFQKNTSMWLEKALQMETKKGKGIRGLVLDLRNNQGGLLDEVVNVADKFIDSGLIAYTDGRIESQKFKYFAHREGTFTEFPIVILVNSRTAAGAEIVAGSLKANGRGTIVGVTTSGKGGIQTILPMEDGSALRLTTAMVFIGETGNPIEGVGVQPDVVVEEGESGDFPLESANNILLLGQN